MLRKSAPGTLCIPLLFVLATPLHAVDLGGLFDAALDMFKAATLSDSEMANLVVSARKESDRKNRLAPGNSQYMLRMQKIMKGMKAEKRIDVNFAVYMIKEVNAFAMPDGSIRVYSGTFHAMTDDELRYIIGHEIGHVALGHATAQTKMGYFTSALRKGMAASGNDIAAALSGHELTALTEKLTHMQYSQAHELEADQYAMRFLKLNGRDPRAAFSALKKLEQMYGSGGSGPLASHPDPGTRAEALERQLAGEDRTSDNLKGKDGL